MKVCLIWILAVASLFDATTSFLGIVGIFGVTDFQESNPGVYLVALLLSGIVLALSLIARDIWSYDNDGNYKVYLAIKVVHLFAVLFDCGASYLGTAQYLILRNSRAAFLTLGFSEVFQRASAEQEFLIVAVALFMTASPILFSFYKGKQQILG